MDYVAPFEIIRNIENAKSKSKKKDEDNKIEEVKEEDEEDKEPPKKSKVEEIKATGEAEENKEAKEKENDNEEDNKNEESKGDKIIRDEQKSKQLLEGFKRLNVKIHLMTGKMSSFYQKSKYKKLFNIVVLSMRCSDRLKKEFNELLADGCYIHIENGNKLVIFDDKNKHDFIVKLKEYTKEANWKELADNYNHHCSFQYLGDDAKIPDYNPIPEYVEDKTNTLPSPDTFSADESTASMTNLTEESMNNEKVE